MDQSEYFTKVLIKLTTKDAYADIDEDRKKEYKTVAMKFAEIVVERVQYDNLKKKQEDIMANL